MATKRGEYSRLIELSERGAAVGGRSRFSSTASTSGPGHSPFKRPNEFIERIVLPTDTLQGLALLYNTSVADIKKLNNLYTENDLHARRVIKLPSRGILINLEDEVPKPLLPPPPSTSVQSHYSSEDDNEDHNVLLYLNGKDNLLKEIQEKAEKAASVSPILNGEGQDPDSLGIPNIRVYNATVDRKKESSIKWWHLFLPCLAFIIIFPILIFLFQEHVHELEHMGNRTTSHPHSHYH